MIFLKFIVFTLIFYYICYLIGVGVERFVPDTHPFKIWWRKHIVDYDPDER